MSLLCRRSLRVSTLFTRHSTFFPIFTRTFFRFANLSTNVAVLPLRAGGKKGGKRGGQFIFANLPQEFLIKKIKF